jgi:hypothetical protein
MVNDCLSYKQHYELGGLKDRKEDLFIFVILEEFLIFESCLL